MTYREQLLKTIEDSHTAAGMSCDPAILFNPCPTILVAIMPIVKEVAKKGLKEGLKHNIPDTSNLHLGFTYDTDQLINDYKNRIWRDSETKKLLEA